MSQTLEFVNPNGNLTLDASEIVAKDLGKVHTGIGDARIDVPQNDAIIPYVQRQDRINYYVDGSVVFTGYAVGFQGNDRTGKWTLRVDGIGKRLEETRPDYQSLGGPLVYTNTALDSAIRDYWGRTPFNATVTDQNTEVVAQDEELQSADTTSEWENVYSPADTDATVIQNGNLELAQSNYLSEAEDATTSNANISTVADYSGGEALRVATNGESASYDFTTQYSIPAGAVSFYIRDNAQDTPEVQFKIDGTTIDTLAQGVGNLSLSWRDVANDPYGGGDGYTGGDLSAGSHTLSIECTADASATGGFYDFDVVCLLDNRYTYNFDNSVDANDTLAGPELYPNVQNATLNTAETSFNITEATITTTWDDTSNNQALAASNDNGSNFLTSSNTATATFDFTTAGRQAVSRFKLSRYGARTDTTPRNGYLGQVVQDYTLTADLNDLVVIDRLELSRDHFANLKQLHDYGDFLWVIQHDNGGLGTLTVNSFPRGQETRNSPAAFSDVENIQPEVAAENYFNSVYVEGALQDDGTRPTADVSDSDAIAEDGREITPGVLRDQNISTEAGARFRANALLDSALDNDRLRGTISTYPVYVQPGFAYSVDFGEGADTKTLESVSITERAGDIQASYEFVSREALSDTISNLKREGRTIGDQV